MIRTGVHFSMLFVLAGATPVFAQPAAPFADAPKQEVKAKPETRSWTVVAGEHVFTFQFAPGIPDSGKVTEIVVYANRIAKTPHPRYGTRIPIENAALEVEIASSAGEVIGRIALHALPSTTGRYGMHFTPTQAGIFNLRLSGSAGDGTALAAEVKFPVEVWPLPPELEGSGAEAGGMTHRSPVRGPVKPN